MLDALEANGSPKPKFETDDARSYFITRLFVHEGFLEEKTRDEEKVVSKMKEDLVDETSFETK